MEKARPLPHEQNCCQHVQISDHLKRGTYRITHASVMASQMAANTKELDGDSTPKTDQLDETSIGDCLPENAPTTTPSLSKSQMKKLAKRQKYLDTRKERRKLEKEKKKAKRKEQIKRLLENGQPANLVKNKIKSMSESTNKFRVVIDMDFEEFMTDNEIGKAAKQVGRIYALNRHSENPCQLYISSLKGKIKERFELTNRNYENWDVNCSTQDYISLFGDNNKSDNNKSDNNDCDSKIQENTGRSNQCNSKFIYLTGDTDETLPTVDEVLKDESTIFVIGGLVDHNRHKSLCFQRATERKIRTAKLPIKENNVQLCQRHILSTITVFEILLNVLCYHKQWPQALMDAIPKRKMIVKTDDEQQQDDHKSSEEETKDSVSN